jgi:Histidine kinase-, DNA gyrase B-, and HSP90-like ATPase
MSKSIDYKSTVSTQPVKRFFVDMLTRDISLQDVLLDLIDNSVDGVLRSIDEATRQREKPYTGYWVRITLSANEFVIEDNCGGIPWNERDRAFRMGNPAESSSVEDLFLMGVYGIGMKRAIFKLGNAATIHTRTSVDEYVVSIPNGWMGDQNDWDLRTSASSSNLKQVGTRIAVSSLRPEVIDDFASEIFETDIREKVATHFAIIIAKGFKVSLKVNGRFEEIQPKLVGLHFQESSAQNGEVIRPYFFESQPERDLTVTVVVGLRQPIPGEEAALNEDEQTSFTTDYAGWTIICNDRVVLYCNRDELTGWGTAGVPRYHGQFIAISGYVEFKGDPRKLPTTTTKRGLEYSSRLYQQVLDRMRDGTKMFTNYTNWWKANETEAKKQVLAAPTLSLPELKKRIHTAVPMTAVHTGLVGKQYKPSLPRPSQASKDIKISFSKPRKLALKLAECVLADIDEYRPTDIPKALGEQLFDDAVSKHKLK